MRRNKTAKMEDVVINYFAFDTEDNVVVRRTTIEIPFRLGKYALAAMVKGLQDHLLGKMEQLGVGTGLSPETIQAANEDLKEIYTILEDKSAEVAAAKAPEQAAVVQLKAASPASPASQEPTQVADTADAVLEAPQTADAVAEEKQEVKDQAVEQPSEPSA